MDGSCSGDADRVTGATCDDGECACYAEIYTEVETTKLCSQYLSSRLFWCIPAMVQYSHSSTKIGGSWEEIMQRVQ